MLACMCYLCAAVHACILRMHACMHSCVGMHTFMHELHSTWHCTAVTALGWAQVPARCRGSATHRPERRPIFNAVRPLILPVFLIFDVLSTRSYIHSLAPFGLCTVNGQCAVYRCGFVNLAQPKRCTLVPVDWRESHI